MMLASLAEVSGESVLVLGTLATATVGAAGAVLAALISTRAHKAVKDVQIENRTDHGAVVEAVNNLATLVDAVRRDQRRQEARADAQDSHLQDLGRNIGALRDQFVAYLLQRLDQEKGKNNEQSQAPLGGNPGGPSEPPSLASDRFGRLDSRRG